QLTLFRTAIANEAYIAAQGRISGVNLPDGSRQVASGWNLPASGFLAVHPASHDYYTADQSDRAVLRVNHTNGVVTMVSGPGIGTGPAFSTRVFGIVAESGGTLVVVDGIGGLLGLVRVDPATGNRVT